MGLEILGESTVYLSSVHPYVGMRSVVDGKVLRQQEVSSGVKWHEFMPAGSKVRGPAPGHAFGRCYGRASHIMETDLS